MKFCFINGYFFNKDKAVKIYCKYKLFNGGIFKANLGLLSAKELLNISVITKVSLISTIFDYLFFGKRRSEFPLADYFFNYIPLAFYATVIF